MSPPIDWSKIGTPIAPPQTEESKPPTSPAGVSLMEKLKAMKAQRHALSEPLDASTFKARLSALEAPVFKPIDWAAIGATSVFRQPPPSLPVPVFEPINTKSESPIEEKMRQALVKVLSGAASIEQQKPLCGGAYRADFAITNLEGAKIVVECDGHDFHEKTREQAARDKKRDRELQIAGWKVLRFTGSEIHRGAENCARDVARALKIKT